MRIVILLLVLFLSPSAWATTYYVRSLDGGDSSTCDGMTDAPAAGATANHCAFNHIFYALGWWGDYGTASGGSPGVMVGGDTLIIKDESVVGYTAGFSGCSTSWSYGCLTRPIPSGTVGNHTKIYGANYASCNSKSDYTKVWGRERAKYIFDLAGNDNIDLKCLEITDKSSCVYNVVGQSQNGSSSYVCNRSGSYPLGNHADYGIMSLSGTTANVNLDHVYIHGLLYGVYAQKKQDWNVTDFESSFNSVGNWDNDVDGGGSTTPNHDEGTINFTRVKMTWGGCGEVWNSPGTPYYCASQDQGGYGDSYGTGGGNNANNNFTDVEMSHNVSDAIDNLYDDGTGTTLKINRGKFEGNAGQAIKSSGEVTHVENVVAIGNCSYFKDQSFTTFSKNQAGRSGTSCNHDGICQDNENSTDCLCANPGNGIPCGTGGKGDCPAFNNCRAGTLLAFDNRANNQKWYIKNSTFYNNHSIIMDLSSNTNASACSAGTLVDIRNSNFISGVSYNDGSAKSDFFYVSGYDGAGGGTCGGITPTEDYNYFVNTRDGAADATGAHSSYSSTASRFVGPVPLDTSYLTGTNVIPNFYLNAPTNDANTAVSCQGDCSVDYQGFTRGGSWDIGGIEYGSVAGGGGGSITPTLASGIWRGILRGKVQ